MSGNPWSKFFWSDWAGDPALCLCSLAAQGLWMRCLCIAASGDPTGYVTMNGQTLGVTDIARMAGVTETEASELIGELDRNGVFSRDRRGRIYSRRMVRDVKKRKKARKNGKLGGNPTLRRQRENSASDKLPDKARLKPQKPYSRVQKNFLLVRRYRSRAPSVGALLPKLGIDAKPKPAERPLYTADEIAALEKRFSDTIKDVPKRIADLVVWAGKENIVLENEVKRAVFRALDKQVRRKALEAERKTLEASA